MMSKEHVGTLATEIVKCDDDVETTYQIEVDYNLTEDRSGDETTPSGELGIDIHDVRMIRSVRVPAGGSPQVFDTSSSRIRRAFPRTWALLVRRSNTVADQLVHDDRGMIERQIIDKVFGGHSDGV